MPRWPRNTSPTEASLDVDAPVAEYWPEFAAGGKEAIPVRWLLSHRAGLSGPRRRIQRADLYDWDRITGLLAAQEPWWEPGTPPATRRWCSATSWAR